MRGKKSVVSDAGAKAVMEEADLLKERLQAITDKRRIQEDIAKKRRQIEEEKLKLQYIKKKALRDQWLMDGLSQQSEEEQAAMRLQAQDEQQRSDQLQSNILRIEKEVETLEAQELSISANEEVVLKRLKEVERTAEDIIKEMNAEVRADVKHHVPCPPFLPLIPAMAHPTCQPSGEEPKKATFAMEISVEHDRKTGRSQVVSTAHVTPEAVRERGFKVYDDGRKSVYAMHPDGGKMHEASVGELTPAEVEEMLLQATDQSVPTGVQYHQPVYAVAYTRSSRPSTPRTPRQTPTPGHSTALSRNGPQILGEDNEHSRDRAGQKPPSRSPDCCHAQQESRSALQKPGAGTKLPYIPTQSKSGEDRMPQRDFDAKGQQGLGSTKMDASSPSPAALVSVKAKCEGTPTSMQPVFSAAGSHECEGGPNASDHFNRCSPFCAESLSDELQSGPITMIFMGYENAEDEEEEDFQAELVIIANSDENDDDDQDNHVEEECPSFHPEGCKSRVFQPKVGIATVTSSRDNSEDVYISWDGLGLHKPTFMHKPGKHSP